MFFSRTLGRSLFWSAPRSARRCRRLNPTGPVGPCAAEVLESRVLLAATLLVDPASTNPAVYHTIQAAVNAAHSGSTIKVAPGLYDENVTVSKSLTILGGQVVMAGESGPSTVEYETTGFTVASANNVTIKGFTIEGDPASTTLTGLAILATNSANSAFENNVIVASAIDLDGGVTHTAVANNSDPTGSTFAIDVTGKSSSNAYDTFTNNILNQGTFALDASATGAAVKGNTVTNGDGFDNDANSVTFTDNTATNNNPGNFADTGNNNTYVSNTATYVNGTGTQFAGFDLTGGGKLTVTNNVADGAQFIGFNIAGGSTLSMQGNTADGNGIHGFNVSVASATFKSNTAVSNGAEDFDVIGGPATLIDNVADTIEVETTSATLSGNTAIEFFIRTSAGATLTGNTAIADGGFNVIADAKATITGNTGEVFDLTIGSGTISDNTSDNGDGFTITITGSNGSVSDNTADNDFSAGFVISLTNGTVSGNTANFNQGSAADIGTTGGLVISGSGDSVTNNVARNNVGDGLVLDPLTHSKVTGNTADNNGGDGIHLVDSGHNTISHNTADANGNDGFDLDPNSTVNTLTDNTALGNTVFDLFDESPGNGTDGTAGTLNYWSNNKANTADPPGLV
jgi:parallel beta-helix repeat protein